LEILKNNKLIILQLLPFILGLLLNYIVVYLPFYVFIIWLLSIGFVLYWFWVGKQFGQLSLNKLLSFCLGNTLWAISFVLFIWQFLLVDDSKRNMFLAIVSQCYGQFTVLFSTKIVMAYGEVIDSNQVMITSYILMFFIYVIGFIYGAVRASKT